MEFHNKLAALARSIQELRLELEKEKKERQSEVKRLREDIISMQSKMNRDRSDQELNHSESSAVVGNSANTAVKEISTVLTPTPGTNNNMPNTATNSKKGEGAGRATLVSENNQVEPRDADAQQEMSTKVSSGSQDRATANKAAVNQPSIKQQQSPRAEDTTTPTSAREAEEIVDFVNNSPSYSDIVQIPGDWNLAINKSQKKRSARKQRQRQERQERTKPRHQPNIRSLRGCVPVKGVQLYLEHIQMNNGDTDDDILVMVKQHGQANDLRVMSAYIVHNRVCSDVVGCKISVPDSQVETAMSPGFWAEDITVRRWENRPRTGDKRQRGDKQGPNKQRTSGYDRHDERESFSHNRGDHYPTENRQNSDHWNYGTREGNSRLKTWTYRDDRAGDNYSYFSDEDREWSNPRYRGERDNCWDECPGERSYCWDELSERNYDSSRYRY